MTMTAGPRPATNTSLERPRNVRERRSKSSRGSGRVGSCSAGGMAASAEGARQRRRVGKAAQPPEISVVDGPHVHEGHVHRHAIASRLALDPAERDDGLALRHEFLRNEVYVERAVQAGEEPLFY